MKKKKWEAQTVKGSNKFYSVASMSLADPSKLMVRDLSCFCVPYVHQDWESCENTCFCIHCKTGVWENCDNTYHIQQWRLIKIKVKDAQVVRDQMSEFGKGSESQFGGDDDCLADILAVEDNFAVPACPWNKEKVQFYIFACLRKKFLVREAFTYKWDTTFEAGDYAIQGRYYQKWGKSKGSFVYLDNSKLAFVSPYLVMTVKFAMPVQNHRVSGLSIVTL
jgi:hypothetical protein